MTTESRVARLRQALENSNLDALLIGQPQNRRYISGFTGTSGLVYITAEEALFFTDFRYIAQAQEQCVGYEVVNQGASVVHTLMERLASGRVKHLGFEQDYFTYAEVERFRVFEREVASLELVPTSGMVESLRTVKDSSELNNIQVAANIADAAFTHILSYLRPGLQETDVALELETFMRRQGASGPSFATIVASGRRSSLPHGVASDKVLETGDLVTMDFGGVYNGYCSDLTRTVVLGPPNDKQKQIYQIVLEAQYRALHAAKTGMTGMDLDAVARDYISSRGYGSNFGHSLGHGIGLAIHEDPRLASTSSAVLGDGMVVTLEPGVYIADFGGVRIEDDIAFVDGRVQVLTAAPKAELIVV